MGWRSKTDFSLPVLYSRCELVLSSPEYEIVEKMHRSSSKIGKSLDVGDHVVFRISIEKLSFYKDAGKQVDLYKIHPDGTEELIDSKSPRQMHNFFIIGPRARYSPSNPLFRIADEVEVEAVKAGVPLEDIYPAETYEEQGPKPYWVR
jgi:hypothetical protein